MAKWTEFDDEGFESWLADRPPKVRAVARWYRPDELFLMDTGHRCTIYSYGELEDSGEISLTVSVTGQFNHVRFDRQVFGIAPESLTPCDLPGPDEALGTDLSPEEAKEWMATLSREPERA